MVVAVTSAASGSALVTVASCVVLVSILVEDLRRYRIRNIAVLALVACFILDCVLGNRLSLLAPHAILAGLMLALAAAAFSLRMMGGGDAKLLSAAAFWVGPEGSVLFAALLLLTTLSYAAAAWFGVAPSRRIGRRLAIPFGPSISLAWLASIAVSRWGDVSP